MRTLKANSKVLGLAVGETFDSDSEFYDPLIETNFLSVVTEDAEEPSEEPVEPYAAPATDVAPEEPQRASSRRRRAAATDDDAPEGDE